MDHGYNQLVQLNARQIASGLIRAICTVQSISLDERKAWRIPQAMIHFHDDSSAPLAWNDVQAVQLYNLFSGEDVPVPSIATEGYNQHGHTSEYDGGYIPGSGPHDHRDNFNGGFAFAVYHPGTALPQSPFAI